MSDLLSPSIYSDEIMQSIRAGVDRVLLELSEVRLWNEVWENISVKIDPSLEAFFVAIALDHGTHPRPTFGVERDRLARQIAPILTNHKGAPGVIEEVRRNYRELGGRLLDADPQWFYTKLADAYLTWLYEQDESKNLLAESLADLEADARKNAMQAEGIAQRKNALKLWRA